MYHSSNIDERAHDIIIKARIKAIVCGFFAALVIKNMWEIQDPSFWDATIVRLEALFAYKFYNNHKTPLNDLINEVITLLGQLAP